MAAEVLHRDGPAVADRIQSRQRARLPHPAQGERAIGTGDDPIAPARAGAGRFDLAQDRVEVVGRVERRRVEAREHAGKEMDVEIDQTRHQHAATEIDENGRFHSQSHDLGLRPKPDDPAAGDGKGFHHRVRRVHRADHAVVQDRFSDAIGLRCIRPVGHPYPLQSDVGVTETKKTGASTLAPAGSEEKRRFEMFPWKPI